MLAASSVTNVTASTIALPACSHNITTNCIRDGVVITSTVGFNAFLYICAVLVFYALSMVCLMVKYIRREKEEAILEQYYLDFVKRETFHSLNRHKYYSELFKKFAKRAGKNSSLSAVYNETDLYARRSIPPGMCHIWDKSRSVSASWQDEGISTGALTDISEETLRLSGLMEKTKHEGSSSPSNSSRLKITVNDMESGPSEGKTENESECLTTRVSVHTENETENDTTPNSGPDNCRSS